MPWIENNSRAAQLAAEEALAQAQRAESGADYIDEVTPKIDEFVGEQTNLQTQLNDLVLQSGTDIAEVVQARGGEPTLNARLTKVNAQLADTMKLVREVHVNVTDFGAKGDWNGTTGTDNLPFFKAALASLPSKGGTIYIPDGDFLLSAVFSIQRDYISVVLSNGATIRTLSGEPVGWYGYPGLGNATTPQLNFGSVEGGTLINGAAGHLDNVISAVRIKNIIIKNVTIPSSDRKGISCQVGVDNIYILNNRISNTYLSAITIESESNNVFIIDNIIENAGYKGIETNKTLAEMARNKNYFITGNIIKGSVGDGMYISEVDNGFIQNNTILNSGGSGIVLGLTSNIKVDSNAITDSVGKGIDISANTGKIDILNNKIRNCTTGVHSHTTDYLTIENNLIENTKLRGIYSHLPKFSLDINNNQIVNTSQGNDGIYNAIDISSPQATPKISGNKVSGANHKYALNQDGANVYPAITSNNDFKSGVSGVFGNYTPKMSNDLVDNQQYIIQNGKRVMVRNGTLTYNGDGATLTKAIPHGLIGTPTFYQVTPSSTDSGTADIKFVTADATNLMVTFKIAPIAGANNVKLTWKAEL